MKMPNLFNKILEFLSDKKEYKTNYVKEFIVNNLYLNDEKHSQKIKNQDELVIVNRIEWAFTGLKKASFLEFKKWGYVNITDFGLNEFNKNSNITIDDLMQYPEFEEWITGNNTNHYFKSENIEEKLWLVRAGEKSFKIKDFLKNNVVAIGWDLGDLTKKTNDEIKAIYKSKHPNRKEGRVKFDVPQINKFVNEINICDYVLTGDSKNNQYYLGKITSDYYISDIIAEKNGEFKNCRKVKWLCTIKREDLSDDAKNPLQSVHSVLEFKDEVKDEILSFNKFIPFSSGKPRNLIYFGAPGTGKSHTLNIDKDELLNSHKSNFERVTFHPDYSYANFVGTYKPVPIKDEETKKLKISYEYVPGPFMRLLVQALKKPKQPFILIIEEINRANAAAVFGDVFQLLDRPDNISKFPIHSSEDMKKYLENELSDEIHKSYLIDLLGEKYEEIRIPENMFIWATMNSADQGVFPLDTAFKRRWDFEYFPINPDDDRLDNLKIEVPPEWKLNDNILNWNDLRQKINNALLYYGINEDKLIGPYFAFDKYLDGKKLEIEDFKDIFENKIIMYLYEDAARSKRDYIFDGANKILYSEICKEFEDKGIRIFCKYIQKEFIEDNDE